MKSTNLCSVGFLFAITCLAMIMLKFHIAQVSAFKLSAHNNCACVCESSQPGKYPICKECQNNGKMPVLKRKISLEFLQ